MLADSIFIDNNSRIERATIPNELSVIEYAGKADLTAHGPRIQSHGSPVDQRDNERALDLVVHADRQQSYAQNPG